MLELFTFSYILNAIFSSSFYFYFMNTTTQESATDEITNPRCEYVMGSIIKVNTIVKCNSDIDYRRSALDKITIYGFSLELEVKSSF